jgi:hypothetical protein
MGKSIKKYIIGTTWDIKRPAINSPYRQRDYFKKIGDEKTYRYWVTLIKTRKIMRAFLDKEWEKKSHLVKSKKDFKILIQNPAEKNIEGYFKTNINDLHTGRFSRELTDRRHQNG